MNETRLLVVTDDKAYVETIRDPLSERYISVFTVSGADQAAKWLDLMPDIVLVILDAETVGMDALQALKQIKISHPLVEVIMMVPHPKIALAIKGMRQGACDYLTKPCSLEVLLAKVEEAGRGQRQQHDKILTAAAQILRKEWEV